MGEMPVAVAAGCLSLEYLVSASAVARGGGNVVGWILADVDDERALNVGRRRSRRTVATAPPGTAMERVLRPGWGFNPMAFLLSAAVWALLLGGVKESNVVTNHFTAFKVAIVLLMTLAALGLNSPQNLTPFLPPELGISGFFAGGTLSFMGYLGYDEMRCPTTEAIDPRKNMPRAILATIATLTFCYVSASLALSGMVPYDEIDVTGGFSPG
ncbi:hypothetical protein ACHAWF_001368, partial [Thalassiosira exigua]